jgi:hypothetical protein
MTPQSNPSPPHPKVPLKAIARTWQGPAVSAPPVLIASTHTIDYGCATRGALLLHAEDGQVHNLVIHCTECGGYNSTDS